MWPYFVSALLIASLSLTLNLWVIPVSQRAQVAFEMKYIKKRVREHATVNRHIYRQIEPGVFAYIRGYSAASSQASYLALEHFRNNEMTASLEAADLKIDPATKRWTASRYITREFDSLGMETFEQFRNLDTLINLEVTELGEINDLIQTMNISQLNEFLDQQRAKGSDSINIIEVERHSRYAYPFSTFILTLIGVSLSSRKVRRRHGTAHRHRHGPLLLVHSLQPFLRGVRQERHAAARTGRLAAEHHLPIHRRLPLPESPQIRCSRSTT